MSTIRITGRNTNDKTVSYFIMANFISPEQSAIGYWNSTIIDEENTVVFSSKDFEHQIMIEKLSTRIKELNLEQIDYSDIHVNEYIIEMLKKFKQG